MAIYKNGTLLKTIEDWERLAPPKGKQKQWCPGRSAFETARVWLENGGARMPEEVENLLTAHPDFGPVVKWEAEPEVKLPFDKFAGEPRNTDLLVELEDSHGRFLMAVEAKADETFGNLLGDALADALDGELVNHRSNRTRRIQQLCQALLGPRDKGSAPARHIRYQLLTACAGILAEAERRNCPRALMLVHEFKTNKTRITKHQQNAHDLDVFIQRLSRGKVKTINNEICGPFEIPGTPLFASPTKLYIGQTLRKVI